MIFIYWEKATKKLENSASHTQRHYLYKHGNIEDTILHYITLSSHSVSWGFTVVYIHTLATNLSRSTITMYKLTSKVKEDFCWNRHRCKDPPQMLFGVRASWIDIWQQAQTAKRPERNENVHLKSCPRRHAVVPASETHSHRSMRLNMNLQAQTVKNLGLKLAIYSVGGRQM